MADAGERKVEDPVRSCDRIILTVHLLVAVFIVCVSSEYLQRKIAGVFFEGSGTLTLT